MKKLEKIKLSVSKGVLVKKELDQLKGGYGDDNNNTSALCICTYIDHSSFANNNSVDLCKCTCV